MSGGTGDTYHTAKEELKKAEAKVSERHGGDVPKDSDISQLKSMVDSEKSGDVEKNRQNLPLPEQPPVASDLKSANQRTTGPGSGMVSGGPGALEEQTSGLRGPATAGSSVREEGDEWKTPTEPGPGVGRQAKEGLEDLPQDAKSRK